MNITFINSVRHAHLSPTGNIYDDIERLKICINYNDYIDFTVGVTPISSYIPELENSVRKYIIAKRMVSTYRYKRYIENIEKLLEELGI
jgi:hypothetical protein